MSAALVLLSAAAATATAVPSPSGTSRILDETQVSPGLIGFLATFAIVIATVLLVIDMSRRVRRLRYRQRVADERQAEAAQARANADTEPPSSPEPPSEAQ